MELKNGREHIIDMHTHMFNARYLPLRGIFKSKGISDKFNKPLAYISWLLTDFSKFNTLKFTTPQHIITEEKRDADYPDLWEARITNSYIEALANDCEKIINECLGKYVATAAYLETTLSLINVDIEDIETRQLALMVLNATLKSLDVKVDGDKTGLDISILNLISKGEYPLKNLFECFFKEAFHRVEHALDYLDFIWNISRSEENIYLRLEAFYDSMNVTCDFVHYMMDMSHPYVNSLGHKKYGKTKLPYMSKKGHKSQLSQMKSLSDFSEGRLFGFAAFDPWRFYNSNNITADVTSALNKMIVPYNMLGVKFYPPMGYRPDEDESTVLGKIEAVLYDYCVDNNIPIFAHCSPGELEVFPNSGELSNPIYWRRMLEKNSKREKLRLCLGHAGGARYCRKPNGELVSAGWVACEGEWGLPNNYAQECVQLCRDFENVYCELSNISSILYNEGFAKNLKQNLIRELNNGEGAYTFSRKIIYGTDWHMVGLVSRVVEYYLFLSNLFHERQLIDFRQDFFLNNAKNFLGIENSK